jgi:PAS domain S-box-containing protein
MHLTQSTLQLFFFSASISVIWYVMALMNIPFWIIFICIFICIFGSWLFLFRWHLILEDKLKDTQLELKMSQLELSQQEALVSSVSDSLIAISKDGNIIFANQSAAELLFTHPEDLLGKKIIEALPFFNSDYQTLSKKDHPFTQVKTKVKKLHWDALYYEHRLTKKRHILDVIATPVMYHKEQFGVVFSLRDVSAQRAAETLQKEFVTLASHQLRTPMTALRWLSHKLLHKYSEGLNDIQRSTIVTIHDSTVNLIELVNMLLGLSRIENGKVELLPMPHDLVQLIKETKDILQSLSDQKHIVIEFSHKDITKLTFDQDMIRQVVVNLISNAIKYSPEHSRVTITVKAENDEAVVSVADQGIGIPSQDQEHIFKRFYRASNASRKERTGNGLGLYYAKQIIEKSGGTMYFTSTPNEGSTFTFTLPM